MKHKTRNCFGIFLLFFLLSSQQVWSQNNVGIGTNQPNSNAVLQIVAPPDGDQGLLIPTITSAQRQAPDFTSRLSSTENGLLVFDIDQKTFFYWMDEQWQPIVSGNITQVLLAGEGIELTDEGIIRNIGDVDSTNDVTLSTQAAGDLSGTFQNFSIVSGGVTTEKIAPDAITTDKVVDNSLLPQDLRSPGAGKVLITTNGGTVFWENQSLFGVSFLSQGRIYIGDSGNQLSEVDVRGEGNILIGNGTTAGAVPVSGDLSLSSTGNMQIQTDAVSANELATGAVGTDEIADGQVGTIDMSDLAITALKLADNAVETVKISDAAVTTDKIADNAVNTSKIMDASIEDADISPAAAIEGSKINPDFGAQKASSASTTAADPDETLTTKDYVDALANEEIEITRIESLSSANIIIGNGTTNQSVAVSGDATLSSSGVLTLNSSAISSLGLGTLSFQDADAVNIINGTINATLSGVGSGITNLNAGEITDGLLPDERLPDIILGGTYGGGAGEYISSFTIDDKGRLRSISVGSGTPSDRRLKKDILKMAPALSKLLEIEPVTYYWKDQSEPSLQYGMIAQELVKIFPEMVEEQNNGYLSVNYQELIPVLIKAIQEQQEQILKLTTERNQISENPSVGYEAMEIQKLKTENEQLKNEIELIKQAIGLKSEASLEE